MPTLRESGLTIALNHDARAGVAVAAGGQCAVEALDYAGRHRCPPGATSATFVREGETGRRAVQTFYNRPRVVAGMRALSATARSAPP